MSGTGGDRPLWEGHRERLRLRMEREGWNALKPYEMVELVLYHAVPRQDLSDIARALVDQFGSVGGVFGASREQLLQVEGMTATLAEWVALTGELTAAYYDLHARRDIRLTCYQDVTAFLLPRLSAAADARLWAIYADFDFNLITYSDLRASDRWWDAANARRMLVDAINTGARYVYLVRFMGDAPLDMGEEDMARLESIAATLRAADVDLVDCVLAGEGGELASMNLTGRMRSIRAESGRLALREPYVSYDD